MLTDRRRSARSNFNRYARYHIEGGVSRDCLIINISDDGVRLHADRAEVPDEFILVLDGAATPRRSCRVVWRLGFELGATFTDRPRANAARPAAALVSA